MASRRTLVSMLALALLMGCGGSSANDDNFTEFTVFLGAEGGFEGTLDASGAIAENAQGLTVGDREGLPQPGPVRACLSFSLLSIPSNATITLAQLRLDQVFVSGTPYTALGALRVDHVNYGAAFPPPGAYQGSMLLGDTATLSTTPTLGPKTCSVTFPVQNDRAAFRTRSQFRLHFANADQNVDGLQTFVRFVDAESQGGVGQVPLLMLTYLVPN